VPVLPSADKESNKSNKSVAEMTPTLKFLISRHWFRPNKLKRRRLLKLKKRMLKLSLKRLRKKRTRD
jgi:hypothetical protein